MSINIRRHNVTVAALLSLVAVTSLQVARGSEPREVAATITEEPHERELREEMMPSDMRPNGGVGYTATLRLGRPGDRDSSPSRCVLLEDGKPLPHPRSLHAAIREQGEGRYSHWTASQLYFSASDSSDPRTNGRRYELVSRESFVRKTATVRAKHAQTSFQVPVPKDVRVRPVSLRLRNKDSQRVVIPRMVRRGDPDLTSAAAMVRSITSDDMTDEQRAIAIWRFLVAWRYHDAPAEGRGEMHDPVKLINVYGYGFCDDSAAAFCELAREAGMKARSYGLSGHVVAEAFYDESWHMFDPDHEVFYRDDDGLIASVAQLEEHPEWITRTERDPIGSPSVKMAEMYISRHNNRPFQAASLPSALLRPKLGPGEEVLFDFADTRLVHRRAYLDPSRPRSYANGTWTKVLSPRDDDVDGPREVLLDWPYAILGGQIYFPSDRPRKSFQALISKDGEAFEPLGSVVEDGRSIVSLQRWIERQPSATYSFWLRMNANSKPSSVDLVFQFAPRAVAQVKPGHNEFDLFLTPPISGQSESEPLSASPDVRVDLVWDEIQ